MTPVGPWLIPRPSARIAVPEGWPCDFRVSGMPPAATIADCRVCGRAVGAWLSCPSVQATAEGQLWDEMHEAQAKVAADRRNRAR